MFQKNILIVIIFFGKKKKNAIQKVLLKKIDYQFQLFDWYFWMFFVLNICYDLYLTYVNYLTSWFYNLQVFGLKLKFNIEKAFDRCTLISFKKYCTDG